MLIKRNENISAHESMLRVFKKNNVEFEAIESKDGEVIDYVEITDDDGSPLKLYGEPNELLCNYDDYLYTKSEDRKIECNFMLKSITDETVNELFGSIFTWDETIDLSSP